MTRCVPLLFSCENWCGNSVNFSLHHDLSLINNPYIHSCGANFFVKKQLTARASVTQFIEVRTINKQATFNLSAFSVFVRFSYIHTSSSETNDVKEPRNKVRKRCGHNKVGRQYSEHKPLLLLLVQNKSFCYPALLHLTVAMATPNQERLKGGSQTR